MNFHDRPLVYLAGPYAHPDPIVNTHNTIRYATKLQDTGLVTVHVPHLTLLWHMVAPHEPDHWYAYDFAVLARCDALYRMSGTSTGADNEVSFAVERGIPVFTEQPDLLDWAMAI